MNWIEKIKSNENEALKELYSLYKDETIYWLKSSYELNEDDAIEILQTSIVIFYDNVMTGKVQQVADVKYYIRGIAKNKVMELFRSSSKTVSLSDGLLNGFLEEELDMSYIQEENLINAEKALEELGGPCRELLTLFYYNDISMEEITTKLGYKNADTTKNQKYKCLKRLQSYYFKHFNKQTYTGD